MRILLFFEDLISGMLPFVLLMLCGIYLSIKSGFFQLRFLPLSVKYALGGLFSKEKGKNGVSPFQAACTALSATVGTGNIAGVAGAIALGGAGAVFWMWISAFAGMIVKSAEIVLSLFYREEKGGKFFGGPIYYIKNGLSKTFGFLAYIFALCGILAVISGGNITQVNSAVAATLSGFYGKLILGIVFAVTVGLVVVGGAKRIGLFTEKIVPLMALIYILMAFGVIIVYYKELPRVFVMIFKGAVNPRAVTGGAIGSLMSAVITGASRGVFSNEAGLGTSAMAHAAAEKNEGVKQSLYGIFEVFADTVVICTLTAVVILLSGVNIEYGQNASTELVSTALAGVYGGEAKVLLSVMMCLFGVSSVIGWGYYGIVCSCFLFKEWGEKIFVRVYPLFCVVGALCDAATAWRLSAFFNGIMLTVNVFAVILLSDRVLREFKAYRK